MQQLNLFVPARKAAILAPEPADRPGSAKRKTKAAAAFWRVGTVQLSAHVDAFRAAK
jgi:hypothetical protein